MLVILNAATLWGLQEVVRFLFSVPSSKNHQGKICARIDFDPSSSVKSSVEIRKWYILKEGE